MTTWNPRWGASRNASRALPLMAHAYFAEVRQFLAADPTPAELHSIRLATKRIRYTLDLFRPCYGPGLHKCIGALQRLQQILGEVNDAVAAEGLIEELSPDSPSRRRIQQFLRRRAAAKASALRKEWQEVFDSPGREQWWLRYLANNARALKQSL